MMKKMKNKNKKEIRLGYVIGIDEYSDNSEYVCVKTE